MMSEAPLSAPTAQRLDRPYEVFTIVSGSWRENCFVVRSQVTGAGVVVDPGLDTDQIWDVISTRDVDVRAILLTHAHHDHVDGAADIHEKTGAAIHLHERDAALLRSVNSYALILRVPFIRVPTPNVLLSGAETLSFEDLTVRVVHMPGHTQGGVGYVIGDLFFVGDTILPRAVGRVDLPGGDAEALRQSIIRGVSQLTERSMLYPGHGEPTNRASLMELNPEVRRVVDEHRAGDPSSEAL